jgi:hypothetical protein
MTMKRVAIISVVMSLVAAAIACGGTAVPSATPDVQASVDAAVAATGIAQANVQATIAVAAEATAVALSTAAAVAPTAVPVAEYADATEEELAAAINGAVTDASTAAEECANAASSAVVGGAAADNGISSEEVETVEAYVVDTEEAIAYAEELIDLYNDLYGELAIDTLDLLLDIEDDLAVLADEVAAIDDVLQEIDEALEAGLALTEETITQLETAAWEAFGKAVAVQAQNQAWVDALQAEIESRVQAMIAVQPNNVPGDRQEAILSAFEYVDAVREGLADDKISPAELANIAQLGANASAGLSAHGGPQLQGLAGSIGGITGQIAGGQIPQARASLGNLESALGDRPSRPSGP